MPSKDEETGLYVYDPNGQFYIIRQIRTGGTSKELFKLEMLMSPFKSPPKVTANS